MRATKEGSIQDMMTRDTAHELTEENLPSDSQHVAEPEMPRLPSDGGPEPGDEASSAESLAEDPAEMRQLPSDGKPQASKVLTSESPEMAVMPRTDTFLERQKPGGFHRYHPVDEGEEPEWPREVGVGIKVQNILKLDHPTYVKLVKRWGAAQNYLLKDRDGDGAAPRKKQKGKAAAAAAASAD